jgi:hypothetical protein
MNGSVSKIVFAGGLSAYAYGSIEESFATGNVRALNTTATGAVYAGGIAAYLKVDATDQGIVSSYASGAVSAEGNGIVYAGGFTGYFQTGIIKNSYALNDVSAKNTGTDNIYAGGIAGYAYSSAGLVSYCYAAGTVLTEKTSTGTIYAGGLVGRGAPGVSYSAALNKEINHIGSPTTLNVKRISTNGTLTNNFAFSGLEIDTVTVTDAALSPQNDVEGFGKTAVELKTGTSYSAPVGTGLGWDFTNIWEMGPAGLPYPILRWQHGELHLPTGFTLIS